MPNRLGIAVCLAGALFCATAAAQPREEPAGAAGSRAHARELDAQARAEFQAGRFREAAELFERANRLVPHPATHFNGALAWDRGGELARAADGYEIALGLEGLDPAMAASARDRLAVLKRQLGYLVIASPIGGRVSVAHAEQAPIPANVHLPPGTHEVRIRKSDGSARVERVELLAGAVVTLKITERDTPAPAATEPAVRDARPEDADVGRTLGWIALGTGAALGITAGVLGKLTLDQRDRCSETRRVSDCDQAKSTRLWTNVAAGAALLGGGIGLVLLLSPREPRSAEVEIGPSGLRARVAF
jgi:hypothetical protein